MGDPSVFRLNKMNEDQIDATLTFSKSGRVSPERNEWIRRETIKILAKKESTREQIKQNLIETRSHKNDLSTIHADRRNKIWKEKTRSSPFSVDLVAEEERIREENLIRLREEEIVKRKTETKKDQIKNEIILKALSDFSDLESLRREKKAIIEEEQRLRALLALEKTKSSGKESRMAAVHAHKQRMEAKNTYRRQQFKDSLDSIMQEEAEALRRKHGLPPSGSVSGFVFS